MALSQLEIKRRITSLSDFLNGKSSTVTLAIPCSNHPVHSWHANFSRIPVSIAGSSLSITNEVASNLADAYQALPNRSDLAFTFTWGAINSTYNDLWLSHVGRLRQSQRASQPKNIQDGHNISHALDEVFKIFTKSIPTKSNPNQTLLDSFQKYAEKIPKKNLNYVATLLLKGAAIEKHNGAYPAISIRQSLYSQFYQTAKKKYGYILQAIDHLANKYFSYCHICENSDGTDVDFIFLTPYQGKSRGLVHEATKIIEQQLLLQRNGSSLFPNDKAWLDFMVRAFLYSNRNSLVHGNSTQRFHSQYVSTDYVKAAKWNFLFAYAFLVSLLFIRGNIAQHHLQIIDANAALL